MWRKNSANPFTNQERGDDAETTFGNVMAECVLTV